ncbi:MAG: inner membrane-spanning protein YciB [Pseudobdellovibrionaceae bacterium]
MSSAQPVPPPPNKRAALLSLFFGGILPILAFTLIEESYGPVWGTAAGMTFGIGEIIFEKIRYGKVSNMTWIANLMILTLGGISIISQDGIWFKLQPALFEGFFTVLLWGSLMMKKPLLIAMAEKQGTQIPDAAKPLMKGMTFRLGLFFAIHTAVATWAAFEWTTAQWAWLKGAGLMVTFGIYLGLEFLMIRMQVKNRN